jgi:hypothetical protein
VTGPAAPFAPPHSAQVRVIQDGSRSFRRGQGQGYIKARSRAVKVCKDMIRIEKVQDAAMAGHLN